MPPTPAPTLTLPAAASPTANAHLTDMLKALQAALQLTLRPQAVRGAPAPLTPALRTHLDDALAAYDRYVQHVVVAHPMSCTAGCTACCHDNPRGVTGVELRLLHDAVKRLPDGEAVLAAFVTLSLEKTDAEAWRRRRIPCPLLSTDGRCRAYRQRPLACRAFHARTPAAFCDPAHPRYAERVNPHLDPPAVLLQLLAAISDRLGLPAPTDLHGGIAAVKAANEGVGQGRPG